jgi:hypothetical protein
VRAIWRRVQRETRDDAAAKRRFHDQARAAVRARRSAPAVGRTTLVDHEAEGKKLRPQAPGRYDLATFTARPAPVEIHRKAESGVVDARAADLVGKARMGGTPLDGALRARASRPRSARRSVRCACTSTTRRISRPAPSGPARLRLARICSSRGAPTIRQASRASG